MVVRKGTQARPKRQPVTAVSAAVPLVVAYHEEVRTRADGAQHERHLCLVEVRLEGAHEAPLRLLTDRPVTTAEDATEVFRRYRQRWRIEDACKIGKQCLGWEDGPVRKLDAVRTLVALGWVGAKSGPRARRASSSSPVGYAVCWTTARPRPSWPPHSNNTANCPRASPPSSGTERASALRPDGRGVLAGWPYDFWWLPAWAEGRAARAGPRAVAHCRRAWSPAAGTAPATLPARSYPSGRCTWDSARQAAGCAGASPNAARPPCSVAR
jgi:hypothetical protein